MSRTGSGIQTVAGFQKFLDALGIGAVGIFAQASLEGRAADDGARRRRGTCSSSGGRGPHLTRSSSSGSALSHLFRNTTM